MRCVPVPTQQQSPRSGNVSPTKTAIMNYKNFSESNSLLGQYLREMRDIKLQSDTVRFRNNIRRIGHIMAYEISQHLNYTPCQTRTPLGIAHEHILTDQIVIASILRAGLPLHEGLLDCFDQAENAFVSAYRYTKDPDSTEIDVHVEYLASPRLDGKTLILCDSMLATGQSMLLSYKALATKGVPENIHLVSIIASQQAIDTIRRNFPTENFSLWVGAVDADLNSHSYIVPGLGDAGDLAFGQKD